MLSVISTTSLMQKWVELIKFNLMRKKVTTRELNSKKMRMEMNLLPFVQSKKKTFPTLNSHFCVFITGLAIMILNKTLMFSSHALDGHLLLRLTESKTWFLLPWKVDALRFLNLSSPISTAVILNKKSLTIQEPTRISTLTPHTIILTWMIVLSIGRSFKTMAVQTKLKWIDAVKQLKISVTLWSITKMMMKHLKRRLKLKEKIDLRENSKTRQTTSLSVKQQLSKLLKKILMS